MGKPFLTIDEQIKLLERRGVSTDESTARLLMREGYYSIVNGYKDPFINESATEREGDDRYIAGTSFNDLYDLYSFDRRLWELTFRYLIRAEATAGTAISYCFSEMHREPNAYLLQSSFCDQAEYVSHGHDEDDYAKEISGLIGILSARERNSRAEFIEHYREAHGSVPLWVLANDLTIGNLEHFYNLMKPREREGFCRFVTDSTGRCGDRRLGYFKPQKAQVCLEVLVRFRNICAHDERLYSAHVGGRKNVNYAKTIWMMDRFLTEEEFNAYIAEFVELLNTAVGNCSLIHVLNASGFGCLADEMAKLTK